MIFVTLGNQNFQFNRLLEKIQILIKNGVINDKVFAQIGHTIFESKHMEIVKFLTKEEFNNYITESNLVITHAGTGSLISSLRKDKKVIAAARLKKYREHIDNHQTEILSAFVKRNFILGLKEDLSDFERTLFEIDNFFPKKFISNNDFFNEKLSEVIKNL